MDDLTATDAVVEVVAPTPAPDFEPMPEGYGASVDEPMSDGQAEEPARTSPAVLADAKNRSLRSLAQGYVMTGLAGLVVVLYPYATSGSLSHVDWKAVGLLCLHPVGSAVFAFAQRVLGKGPKA